MQSWDLSLFYIQQSQEAISSFEYFEYILQEDFNK